MFAPVFVTAADSAFSWCWCHVTRFSTDSVGLSFDIEAGRRIRATQNDVQILQRVLRDFSTARDWDRHSDRNRAVTYCARNASSHTLFCSLYAASVAMLGDYYPSPAVRAIQDAINRAAPRRYQHPLDGFNNDPQVDFAAFRRVLETALRELQDQLASVRSGV